MGGQYKNNMGPNTAETTQAPTTKHAAANLEDEIFEYGRKLFDMPAYSGSLTRNTTKSPRVYRFKPTVPLARQSSFARESTENERPRISRVRLNFHKADSLAERSHESAQHSGHDSASSECLSDAEDRDGNNDDKSCSSHSHHSSSNSISDEADEIADED